MLAAEVAQAMAGSLALGSVIDVEGAGHSVPGVNAEAFETVVRGFLRSIELHKN